MATQSALVNRPQYGHSVCTIRSWWLADGEGRGRGKVMRNWVLRGVHCCRAQTLWCVAPVSPLCASANALTILANGLQQTHSLISLISLWYCGSPASKYVIKYYYYSLGARGSVVVKALCYKPDGRGFDNRWGEFLKIYIILPAALGPGVYSASNRNEYQKQKNNNVSRE
jgi:hypothetical protein